jgi:SAM-dependent methyltransferase
VSLSVADIVAWDTVNWSQAVAYWAHHAPLSTGHLDCLELGAFRGGLSAWLAAQGNYVVCSDVARTSLNARPLIEREGLLDRVTFEDIDATKIPYDRAFDVILFKSVLGGVGYGGSIERQRQAMASIHHALKDRGLLLFAENLRGCALHEFFRHRFVTWGLNWRYVTILEMREFLAGFAHVDFDTCGVLGTLGRSELQRVLLGQIDCAGLSTLVPPQWRYIIFGIAQK